MDSCCTIVVILCVIALVVYCLHKSSEEKEEAKQRVEKNIKQLKDKLSDCRSRLNSHENRFKEMFQSFFENPVGSFENPVGSYVQVCTELRRIHAEVAQIIAEMYDTNEALVKEADRRWRQNISEDQTAAIQSDAQLIPRTNAVISALGEFGDRVRALPLGQMLDEDSYGRIHQDYWDAVCAMTRQEALDYISHCEALFTKLGSRPLDNEHFTDVLTIDPAAVLKCVWFFATEKTFSAPDFQRAEAVFNRIYKANYAELMVAELYAKRKMGSEDVLREPLRGLLGRSLNSRTLTLLASGLMWMNAYQSETDVLQHMLNNGIEMSAKAQERLHAMTNGGGNAPSGFDVASSHESLYFDVSALAWRDEEYIGLFENLSFQDKTLTYSLAVRDENKDIFIPQGVQVPETGAILSKLNSVFAEEYGNTVTARAASCVALSGSGEERMEAILASSAECPQMGILIHIARIGRKLVIKFYTLFMPTGTELAAQKQQVLSMYKRLSPSVAMWEGSLKDTMLMAVERLLNTMPGTSETPSSHADDEPLF